MEEQKNARRNQLIQEETAFAEKIKERYKVEGYEDSKAQNDMNIAQTQLQQNLEESMAKNHHEKLEAMKEETSKALSQLQRDFHRQQRELLNDHHKQQLAIMEDHHKQQNQLLHEEIFNYRETISSRGASFHAIITNDEWQQKQEQLIQLQKDQKQVLCTEQQDKKQLLQSLQDSAVTGTGDLISP